MAASRRSGNIEEDSNIKEEWQHPRRRGDKIKDFRVRLTCCVAMGTKHQLFGDIVAKIKDISETSQKVEKLLQYFGYCNRGKNQKLSTHQSSSTSNKDQQHWRSGKGGMAISM